VRQTANWMLQTDERILEELHESGELTAWKLAFNLDEQTGFVRHRCRVLGEAGFVYRVPREKLADQFGLSIWGQLYLDGDLDANLRRPLPRARPGYAVRPGWWAGFG
jgi:hypothetical protein